MIACIDIGGTALKYASYTLDAQQVFRDEIPNEIKDYDEFLQTIVSLVQRLDDIEGIAISMPGLLDTQTGTVVTGGALTFNAGHHVVEDLKKLCHVPVSIQNDGKCAALAELWMGSLMTHQHGIVFVIGTGIGGGIIIDHKLYAGAHAFAGELSFVMNGSLSFDTWLGATGSVKSLLQPYEEHCGKEVNGKDFFAAVRNHDAFANEVLHAYAKRMALQFYNLQALYDPEVIAIGGGISAQPILLATLQEELERFYQQIPFDIPHANLVRCTFGNDANLIGALYQYHQQCTTHP